MRALIQQLRQHRPTGIHTIVLIGAGDGADLPELRTLNGRKTLLVEANPEQLEILSRRIEPSLGEEILPMAATASPGDGAKMFLCNNPRYSSLGRARELQKYFPNLHVTGEVEVQTSPLSEILSKVSDTGDTGKLLILDAPGQSATLVRSVPGEALQAFDWVIVGIANAVLFEGDDAAECLAALDAAGFDLVAEDKGAISPERRILLQRDDSRVQRERLKLERERHSEELVKLEARHKSELEKLEADAHGQAEEHKAQLEKLTAERDQQAKLAGEHKSALDQSIKQNQERGARIAQLERENAELGKRQNRLDQEMAKAEAQIDLIKDVWLRDTGA